MTKVQEMAIEKLKQEFLGFYGYPQNNELKIVDVTEYETGNVYVMLEVGRIGDEGTMGEVLCRKQLSVFVGKKGGYFNYSDSRSHYRKTYNSAKMVCIKAQW